MKEKKRILLIGAKLCCLAFVLGAALAGGQRAGARAAAVDSRCVPDDSTFMTQSPPAQPARGLPVDGQETLPRKRVFLTFDDGPSPTTERVLDILKEENVPATFFVIAASNNEEYLPILERTVAEGHQLALHSCSHEYKEIYKSPEAFWQDLRDLKAKLKPYVEPSSLVWLRFPGGSTNTVYRRYGPSGLMDTLKQQAKEAGYHYVDWNVCADDAVGGHPGPEKVLQNVVEDVGDKETCVVLMHDTKATGTTAEALPGIIHWFRERDFDFCRIRELAPEE